MKIAFDMDGVLRDIDMGFFKLCQTIGWKETGQAFKLKAIWNSPPSFNPMYLALPTDQVVCITNCSTAGAVDRKARWLKHYYGERVELYPVQVAIDAWGLDYCVPVAMAKLDIMRALKVDVYFDDDPLIIRALRLMDSGIKFMKLGYVIEEYNGTNPPATDQQILDKMQEILLERDK